MVLVLREPWQSHTCWWERITTKLSDGEPGFVPQEDGVKSLSTKGNTKHFHILKNVFIIENFKYRNTKVETVAKCILMIPCHQLTTRWVKHLVFPIPKYLKPSPALYPFTL